MAKILSQAGVSLADTYDVQGSIAGVEQLESREVALVHEMGGTIFSERFGAGIRRGATAALLQSVSWDVIMDDFPNAITRVNGVLVFAAAPAGRVAHAQISIRDRGNGREIPIFQWDAAIDPEPIIRMDDNGAGVADFILLRPVTPLQNLPSFLTGFDQRTPANDMSQIAFRGETTAFGAGTVITRAIICLAFSRDASGLSSKGLPVPGW